MGLKGDQMKQKVLVKGPVLTQSGYGEQARFALRALRSKESELDIYIIPTAWGQTGWISVANEERTWIDQCIAKTHLHMQQGGTFDISLQVTIPNEWETIAPVNIGYTAGIETTKVSPLWLQKANIMNKIIVVSSHSKEVFEKTIYQGNHPESGAPVILKCEAPIEVVNYPVRRAPKKNVKLNLDYDFNFLAISQWGPRKNFDNLINWFIEENFDQEVGLVLKTSIKGNSRIDRHYTEQKLEQIVKSHGDIKCKVYLLHGDLTESEMTGLYSHSKIKALISTTHGEGYGLPLFEAAYNGLPVIAPGWSGQRDFLYVPDNRSPTGKLKPLFATVEYDLQNVQSEAVWDGVIQADSQWAFPKESSFKKRLREVRTNYSRFKKSATKLKKYLTSEFTEEKMYSQFSSIVSPGIESREDISSLKSEILKIKNPSQRSAALGEQIRTLSSQAEKLELLKDSFKGETCYVLSCGPTITDHNTKKIKELLSNNVVIAVKQAFDLFAEHVDFHTYNCANFKHYDYSSRHPISIESSTSPRPLGNCDIKFFIRERDFNKSVAVTSDFSKWTYENSALLRPYGPGIMYESVFYLAQHLGVSEIITIGWDNSLIKGGAAKQHFYDKVDAPYNKEDFIHQNEVAQNPNAVATLDHEATITTNAISAWNDWLQLNNITLKIISDINPAPNAIQREKI
tara:strand:+ start:8752 stop:10803 length:2052 start_codon:yes stop_codon:yes gene_type:complete